MRVLATAKSGAFNDLDMLAPLRWLPEKARIALSVFLLTNVMKVGFRSFDQVAREHALQPFASFDGLFERSNHLLVAEPPDFSTLPPLPTSHYIGPLIARLNQPIPDEIKNLPRDRPIIYFAMGSSGDANIVACILASFAGKPYRVIAPVKSLLNGQAISVPENVLLTDWLPAHLVNPLADLSVIHGGIGTVMTACLAGIPIVGVAMQPEQQANLDNLIKKGFAVRIPKGQLTPQRLCAEIDRLLADPLARHKAQEYQQIVKQWDNPQQAQKFFRDSFGTD
jgi:UDP:flavonoid glycosyltransferase YjiC (YdhE family)